MADYRWRPIEPLSDREREVDLAAIHPLYDSWRAARDRLRESSAESLSDFYSRLVRRLSIETGILERIYDLDRGTTEALVAQGFAEDLIAHSSTNIEPAHLIDILRDQEAAIELVMDCVKEERPLTKGLIHELHAILMNHQDTTTAVDQFGQRREIPLKKGAYKEQPNNPKRGDGSIHEYAPPVQVESQMDNLLGWLDEYQNEDPILVATWLHHRFTQIHPYQDGNGRVGRAILALVLLRADLLPLVIDRDLRTEYITALEAADLGDLGPLALIFARLERVAILQALSVEADKEISHERSVTSAVIESLGSRLQRRREEKYAELRIVDAVAESLRGRTREVIESGFSELSDVLSHRDPDIHVTEGGPDRDNAHWYKYEVVKSGESSGKFINFDEAHYFLKATIRVDRDRLVFVTSFHHVGRQLTGIMEATAFARLEAYEESEDRELVAHEFFPCTLDPFVITWKTDVDDAIPSFDRWLDAALAVAIKEYGDRL